MWFRVPVLISHQLRDHAWRSDGVSGGTPLEATYGIDAALKSADVQLVTYVPPPSETNYSAAFLTGSQAACKAACNAFTDAVLEIARNPIQRA